MEPQVLSMLLSLPDERPHVHGFHPYPARFAPALAGALLADLAPGSVVFDPFAGSATTLVEARLRGCHAWGNDLNPVAVLLCRVKADSLPHKAFPALENDLAYLRKYVANRLRNRDEEERVRLPAGERLFHPHVYWELQMLVAGIERIRHPHNQEIYLAALSAVVNRVSLRSKESQPKQRRELQIGARRTAQLFFEAAEQLLADLRAFSRAAKPGRLAVWMDDARELPNVPDGAVDRIVTSPPYGGTYDYAEMHALRGQWLGLDWRPFEKLEIAPRRARQTKRPEDAFAADYERVFAALKRVAKDSAKLYWVVADGVIGSEAFRGDEVSTAAAAKSGWTVSSLGSVERPIWSDAERKAFGKEPKREYLMEFTLSDAAPTSTPRSASSRLDARPGRRRR